MAYQTGAATSPDDLLDKLRLWLIDCGWAVNKWETDNTYYGMLYSGMVGTGKRLHVQKTASTGDVMYFNFRSVNRGAVFGTADFYGTPMPNGRYQHELTGIGMYGSTGYSETRGVSFASTGTGTDVTVYCASKHRFQVGQSVTISGTASINGVYVISSIPDESQFKAGINVGTSQAGVATGPAAWDKQPGNLETVSGNSSYGVTIDELSLSSIPAYHFFQNGDCYAVVVEYAAGKYHQFVFGTLKKQGAFTGGQFFSGSIDCSTPAASSYYKTGSFPVGRTLGILFDGMSNGAVYLEADSVSRWRSSGGRGDQGTDTLNIYFNKTSPFISGALSNGSPYCFDQIFLARSPNSCNALAAMCPIIVEAKRSSGNYSVIGSPEGVRSLNITHYSNAQEITFGSETWMVFPCHDKTYDTTPNIGMAFKKA